jgi:hypothetical protein
MGDLGRLGAGAAVVVTALIAVSLTVVARVPGVVVRPEPVPAWTVRIDLVDQALADGNLSRAVYEWREAYGDAFRSGLWEALADVGDAAVRIEAMAGRFSGYRAEARRAYLAALLRARALQSAAGAMRVAEAFARLGDAEMAERARRIAAELS